MTAFDHLLLGVFRIRNQLAQQPQELLVASTLDLDFVLGLADILEVFLELLFLVALVIQRFLSRLHFELVRVLNNCFT